VRAEHVRLSTLDDALRATGELRSRTIVIDVEPLVAYWDSGQQALDEGIARVVSLARQAPGAGAVQVLCFSTNSARRPSRIPEWPGIRVVYFASARKPFHTAPYRSFPAPGAVIGDQVLTDGLLARRLGYAFIQCTPELDRTPAGPAMLARGGQLALPLLFRRLGGRDR
jgi:predicted HAD superfamily phosphohydrolase YqeG